MSVYIYLSPHWGLVDFVLAEVVALGDLTRLVARGNTQGQQRPPGKPTMLLLS